MYVIKLICEALIIIEIIRKVRALIVMEIIRKVTMNGYFDIRLLLFIITQIIVLIPFANKSIYIINLFVYFCNNLIYDKKLIGVNRRINTFLNILNVFAFMTLYLIRM